MLAKSLKFFSPQKGVPVKFIICARSDFAIKYSVFEKVWFTINGQSKMLFFNFCFFPLPKFQMTIVKNLIMNFEGS